MRLLLCLIIIGVVVKACDGGFHMRINNKPVSIEVD